MNENRVKRNSMLAQKLIKELKDRNIEAFYAEGKDEARSLALSMIPEGSSVGWGGSMTIDEIGLKDAVIQGNYIEINRDAAASPEIKEKLMRDILLRLFPDKLQRHQRRRHNRQHRRHRKQNSSDCIRSRSCNNNRRNKQSRPLCEGRAEPREKRGRAH